MPTDTNFTLIKTQKKKNCENQVYCIYEYSKYHNNDEKNDS